MYNYRRIILFLNIIRLDNKTILNIIKNGLLDKFIDLKMKNINRLYFLKSNDKQLIKDNIDNINLDYEIHKLSLLNINFCTIIDRNYPSRLKQIYDAPSILYYKGKEIEKYENNIAIVGTRKPTDYGLWATKNIVSQLKEYDINTVSGMAIGIDACCHKTSLDCNIPTVGVLASSLEIKYPKRNLEIYDRMKNEILVSEFPLNTRPLKRNFVFRNRIISGLSLGVLVVEAYEKSGSLITANYAIEQNREVFAIPGNINNEYSKGCNKLIKKGAKIIEDAKDIIEELKYIKEIQKITNIREDDYNIEY